METPLPMFKDPTTPSASPTAAKRGKTKKLLCYLFLVFLINMILINYNYLLFVFANQFRINEEPRRSDAIIILLGKVVDRSSKAAELYTSGLAPVILMGPTEKSSGEAEFHRGILLQGRVPKNAIRILPGEAVRSTQDEALRLRDYVRTHPMRRITVVTTAFHTARTRWTFRKALRGTGVEIRMVASKQGIDEKNWYSYKAGIKLYFGELIKTLYYHIVY